MMLALLFIGIIAIDQIVKSCIRTGFMLGESLPIISGFFKLTYVRNEGAAFSMFENNEFVTIGLTIALLLACIVIFVKAFKKGEKALCYSLVMIIAGGISNLYDRLFLGYVTDMFSFGSFAIFNVADIFIVVGCILTMLVILTSKDNR